MPTTVGLQHSDSDANDGGDGNDDGDADDDGEGDNNDVISFCLVVHY